MINQTTDYEIFKFLPENREVIDERYVEKILKSIEDKNLLRYRPIIVNERMEILDGQHRLLAAKKLGVAIYYEIITNSEDKDIINLNISKTWVIADFQNYYCRKGYPEYLKLEEFRLKNKITLKIALMATMGFSQKKYHEYKLGNYKYIEQEFEKEMLVCWDTIHYIKKIKGQSCYTASARFWQALMKVIRHPNFDAKKWNQNMIKHIDKFGPRARTEDYLTLFTSVFNYRNNARILFDERGTVKEFIED